MFRNSSQISQCSISEVFKANICANYSESFQCKLYTKKCLIKHTLRSIMRRTPNKKTFLKSDCYNLYSIWHEADRKCNKKLHDGECEFECGTDVAFKSYFEILSVSPTYSKHLIFCMSCLMIAVARADTFWSIKLFFVKKPLI